MRDEGRIRKESGEKEKVESRNAESGAFGEQLFRGQKSEVRSQKSEVRCQMSDVRCRMSDVRDQLSVIGERRAAATHDDVTAALPHTFEAVFA